MKNLSESDIKVIKFYKKELDKQIELKQEYKSFVNKHNEIIAGNVSNYSKFEYYGNVINSVQDIFLDYQRTIDELNKLINIIKKIDV